MIVNHVIVYPPPDDMVSQYLGSTRILAPQEEPEERHAAFLRALFNEAADIISHLDVSKKNIATEWYNWLNKGASTIRVGTNRRVFHHTVVLRAYKVCFTFTFNNEC